MKRTIRLRESELRRLISESVRRILREGEFDGINDIDGPYDEGEIGGYEPIDDDDNLWGNDDEVSPYFGTDGNYGDVLPTCLDDDPMLENRNKIKRIISESVKRALKEGQGR